MKNTKGKRFLALALLAVSLVAIGVPALAITPFDYGDTCYVRAGLTNVRVNHSTSANRIYYANKGDAVVVYDIWEPASGLAWYFVANLTQPGQRNGWIRSDCVQATRP